MSRIDFNVKKLESTINTKASALIRKVVLDGMKNLVRQSPVDTGRFKANWSTSINIMDAGTSGTKSKTPYGSLSSPAVFKKSSENIANYKLGQTMFLHNNLKYALPLEYGTSKQAGAGWIRNTAELLQRKLNELKNIL